MIEKFMLTPCNLAHPDDCFELVRIVDQAAAYGFRVRFVEDDNRESFRSIEELHPIRANFDRGTYGLDEREVLKMACDLAWEAYDQAGDVCQSAENEVAYRLARKAYDQARETWVLAWEAWQRARIVSEMERRRIYGLDEKL